MPVYDRLMDRDAIVEFATRDRGSASQLKRAHRVSLYRRGGGEATFRASQALLVHLLSIRPDLTSGAGRSVDFDHHVRLKQKLDRASRALSGR